MDCHKVLNEVSDYIHGEVPPSLRAEIDVHLGCCPNCHVIYNTVEKTIQLYCEGRVEVPEAVRQRIKAALQGVFTNSQAAGTGSGEGSDSWFGIEKRDVCQEKPK